MRRRIQERVNQYQAEMQTLNRTKHELSEGRAKINDIIAKLEREEVNLLVYSDTQPNSLSICIYFQSDLKANISVLQNKEKELEKSLETLEKVEGIDVDEAVTTTAPLYKQ